MRITGSLVLSSLLSLACSCQSDIVRLDSDGDGWVDSEDCRPEDPAVHPGVAELCDGIDNDCDGRVDVRASDAATWFVDDDGDGYGGERVTTACTAPADHVDNDLDCDDTLPAVYPGAPEICEDGVVNDCDGELADVTCRLEGEVLLSNSDWLVPVGSGGCAGYGIDIDFDGVDDLTCTALQAVFGPIVPGAQRPDFLVDRSLPTTGWVFDATGDGVLDVVINGPERDGLRSVHVAAGPWTNMITELPAVAATYPSDWRMLYPSWAKQPILVSEVSIVKADLPLQGLPDLISDTRWHWSGEGLAVGTLDGNQDTDRISIGDDPRTLRMLAEGVLDMVRDATPDERTSLTREGTFEALPPP